MKLADHSSIFPRFYSLAKDIDAFMHDQREYSTKKAWGGWAYLLDGKYSLLAVEYKDHVKLMIWRGVMVEDAAGVLEGKGDNTRHIKLFSVDDFTQKQSALKDILSQQAELYASGIKAEGAISEQQ